MLQLLSYCPELRGWLVGKSRGRIELVYASVLMLLFSLKLKLPLKTGWGVFLITFFFYICFFKMLQKKLII